ncbi:MAG TPA: HAMP domain-containing sensor histidine kinase [Chitinophagaceae bacterium]|nr:HAMP domain-containing sensor histidine kinase [Chitinophagaceae bacterium]
MKKIFPIIIGLISLSLIGIIVIQLLWLKNMVLLKQEQVKHKIQDGVTLAGNNLVQHKANYNTDSKSFPGLAPGEFSIEYLRPNTVGQRLSVNQIEGIIRKAFHQYDLDNVKFEFGVAINPTNFMEKQSKNFVNVYNESNPKNYPYLIALNSPSGSETENLSPNEMLIVIVMNYQTMVFESLWLPIVSAIVFTLLIMASFYLTVRTMLRQKKLSEIKNDFINNMTHEFKTPLATISLAVDALKNDKVASNKEKMNYFSTIIKEENKRMNRQVETILKAALLDKQEVQLLKRPIHTHQVIKDVVENFTLQLEEKNGKAELLLNAENDLIDGDEIHFSNLINNLIDNSIKYSKEDQPPLIKITTQSTERNLVIVIEDNGIGMNKETVKRVFEKFYRAHTGNIHNVKGFGLGLSYVKTMVEAHGGEIKVDSVLGRGSTFTLEFPLKKLQRQPVISPVPA